MSKRKYDTHTEQTSIDDVIHYAIKDVCDGLKQPYSFLQDCKMCKQLGRDLSRLCSCANTGLLCVRARKLIRWLHHKKGCHSRQFLDIIVHDPIVDITSNILDYEGFNVIGSFFESSLQSAEMRFLEKQTEDFGFESDWCFDPFYETSLCIDTLFRHEYDEEIQLFECHMISDLSLAISSALFHVEHKCYRHMWRLPAPPCNHIDPQLYGLVKKYYFLCINLRIGLISYTEAHKLLTKCMMRIFDEAGFEAKSDPYALDSILELAAYQRTLPKEYSCTKTDAEITEFLAKLKS